MKLLFDHNLSPRLVDRLADMYPNSQHLFLIDLDQADDLTVWEYARQNGFTVVSGEQLKQHQQVKLELQFA